MNRNPLLCFTNSWDPAFLTRHDPTGKDDVSAVETKRSMGDKSDPLTIFLGVLEDLGYPCEADEVKRHCGGVILKDLEDGVGQAGKRRAAWLDDRNSQDLTGSGNARLYANPLTATGLLGCLKQTRYENGPEPTAERRLIYISDLTPQYILTLAVTAPFHQVPALRGAMCKHVAFQSSIRVIIPSDGVPTFQMEFHFPYFALRNTPPLDSSTRRAQGNHLRKWKDLYFLRGDNTEPEDQKYYIHQAHISCVVSGLDEWHWNAYVFVDTEHDGEDSADKVTPYDGLNRDPILRGRDANLPIWRPREYFLKALETRVNQVKEEWCQLVRKLELDISEYKRAHPFTCSDASRNKRDGAEELKRSFNWTLQKMELLSEIHGVLSENVEEWNAFISRDGDVGYFSDLDKFPTNSPEFRHAAHAGRSLRSIKEAFERLRNLRQKLVSLIDSLAKFSEGLKLRLMHEGNKAIEDNGFTSEFSVWILYPITLTATIFSMQPSVMPFGLTPVWFCITVFMLMGTMTLVHRVMKRWNSWQKKFALWVEAKRLEEEADSELETEYRNQFIANTYNGITRGDLESLVLGTRVIRGRARNFRNEESEITARNW